MSKRQFIRAEDGAVTIDWVALAAGLLILGVGIVGLLTDELQSVTDEIEAQLASASSVNTLTDGTSGSGGTPAARSFDTGYTDQSGEPINASEGDLWFDQNEDGEVGAGDQFVLLNGATVTQYSDGTGFTVDGGEFVGELGGNFTREPATGLPFGHGYVALR